MTGNLLANILIDEIIQYLINWELFVPSYICTNETIEPLLNYTEIDILETNYGHLFKNSSFEPESCIPINKVR